MDVAAALKMIQQMSQVLGNPEKGPPDVHLAVMSNGSWMVTIDSVGSTLNKNLEEALVKTLHTLAGDVESKIRLHEEQLRRWREMVEAAKTLAVISAIPSQST